jgi:ABC-2 type transport system permease protein
MWLAELAHLYRRRRIQVILLVLALVPIGIATAVRFSGGPQGGEGPQFLNQVTHNGVFASLAALTITLPVFLPLAVSVVAGDAVAGEAGLGTLRYLLVRPTGRTRLIAAKALSLLVFCLSAALTVAVAGLLIGVMLFPVGRVTTLSGTTLPLTSGMVRIAGAALIVGLSLLGLSAIGLFVSTMTDVAVGAMAVTLGLLILSAVLDAIPQVAGIHPWLLTHDWLTFGDLLRSPIQWGGIRRNLLRQLAYVAAFGTVAWARFTTKDVLA